jgi:cytochrome bd ubiquinol oxidase subunit I
MIFGWKKVYPLLHLFATFFVLVGVHYSAFWIIVINSFMHTPSGVELIDGILHVTSWKEIIFTPSMPYRLSHMLVASYLTSTLLIAGRFANYYKKKREFNIAQKGFSVALQVILGDLHG